MKEFFRHIFHIMQIYIGEQSKQACPQVVQNSACEIFAKRFHCGFAKWPASFAYAMTSGEMNKAPNETTCTKISQWGAPKGWKLPHYFILKKLHIYTLAKSFLSLIEVGFSRR